MNTGRWVRVTVLFFVLACTGCGLALSGMGIRKPVGVEMDADQDLVRQPYMPVENPYEGSLWSPRNSRAFLFGDNKARNVNDILTVNISEITDASRDATTSVSKKGGIRSGISKFFGSDLSFGMGNLWGRNTGAATAAERTKTPFSPEIETDSQNSFSGTGSTQRKDKVIATISAKVCEVYPNGNMLIRGRREITINNERQFIKLSGIVRPEDISVSNEVVSTAIADAMISISGKGVIADKQDPGYGHRLFDFIWPF